MNMDGCSILTISSSRDHALNLLRRLLQKPELQLVEEEHVSWKITNKYYSADVHFQVQQLSAWSLAYEHLEDTPAAIFVWADGEPYRVLFQQLSQKLSEHEFEVALAVRIPGSRTASSSTSAGSLLTTEDEIEASQVTEDDQDVDAYFSEHGFEFVDIRDTDTIGAVSDSERRFDRDGALGLPRVIDALSTIMWPSMVQNPTGKKDRIHNFLADDVGDDGLSTLINRRTSERGPIDRQDRMQRELEALERWLDEGNSDDSSESDGIHNDQKAANTDPWQLAPRPRDPSNSIPSKAGFEDDFAAFVSAPSISTIAFSSPSSSSSVHETLPSFGSSSFSSTFSFDTASSTSGRSTPTLGEHDDALLAPGGIPYKSLGSVSDFGDDLEENTRADSLMEGNDEEGDIPTRSEIAATSRRIFGSIPMSLSPTDDRSMRSHLPPTIEETETVRPSPKNVLSTLQGLKEEISGMSDSKERRRAAAKVALGLVYGLHEDDGV
ncbi:hypothetical protein BV22DRAFT_1038237 [Leucogyrophana mollusca]|uniref:Uncharacterized protein n=1 Tax=Leucogyrophana mollusca TaxID=85980 RepID=A0ACB8B7J0_9AGAM|nr:hypothetical protein BV22DRAFT_1038237 [Leucogyrophana mollusca]